jgi:hypothetical protein
VHTGTSPYADHIGLADNPSRGLLRYKPVQPSSVPRTLVHLLCCREGCWAQCKSYSRPVASVTQDTTTEPTTAAVIRARSTDPALSWHTAASSRAGHARASVLISIVRHRGTLICFYVNAVLVCCLFSCGAGTAHQRALHYDPARVLRGQKQSQGEERPHQGRRASTGPRPWQPRIGPSARRTRRIRPWACAATTRCPSVCRYDTHTSVAPAVQWTDKESG